MTDDDVQQLAAAIAPLVVKALQQDEALWQGIDWTAVDLGNPKSRRCQTSQFSPLTFFLMKAIAHKSYSDSLAQAIQTAVEMYLKATLPKHLADFRAIAANQGITLEQALGLAYKGELLKKKRRSQPG